mgnify:CR=1 FL=1
MIAFSHRKTYVGQHVAVVSATSFILPTVEQATVNPEGHMPGEKRAVRSGSQPEGKQFPILGGPRLAYGPPNPSS